VRKDLGVAFAKAKKEKASKRPILLIGRGAGTGQGVRGTRSYIFPLLEKYLAEFFLILTVDEFNSTKLCPKCHHPTEFACKDEIRSKVCRRESCKTTVTKDDVETQRDFFYDRDVGAAMNFYFIAVFMAKSGGKRPPPFAPKEKTRYKHAASLVKR
jgi:hypothetical protein